MSNDWTEPYWEHCQPKHFLMPEGAIATSWAEVEAVADLLAIELDTWQTDLGRAIHARDDTGELLAGTVALSVPRQSGKTFLLALLTFADCWTHPERTAVWSAHAFRPALETFTLMRDWALALGVERREIKTAAGAEAIKLPNGSRIVFAARARGVVRGFSGVSRLILDEAQILPPRVMADLVSTTRVAASPQVLLAGTPPKPGDDCEVFTTMRSDALSGVSEGLLWAEWGADPDDDPDDRDAWSRANPSTRTPVAAIKRERRLLTDADFRREALGTWREADAIRAVIAAQLWQSGEAAGAAEGTPPTALAVDMSHERVAAVAGCWLIGGYPHVELLAQDTIGADPFGVIELLVELAGRRIPVLIDSMSPAASMIPALKSQRVNVIQTAATDMAKACGMFYDDVQAERLTHPDTDDHGKQALAEAVSGAARRSIGTAGGWGWDRRDPAANIAPLVAVTLARFGASVTKQSTGRAVFA